jgi:GNAT superfamily N-acetyltransferase
MSNLQIVPAVESDVPVILSLIRELAEYEKLLHLVTATEKQLRETLFGAQPAAEVILAFWERQCVGFALFFPTYSTFLARPGIYLEDLYVQPHVRGRGIGLALISYIAKLGVERDAGRMEWEVLNWNEPSIRFYEKLGAKPLHDWTRYRLTRESLAYLASLVAPPVN